MTTIRLKCEYCGKKFDRSIGDYHYALKKRKGHFFCSRSCSCSWINKNCPKKPRKTGIVTRFKDEFTPFRCFYRMIKRRAEGKDKRRKSKGKDYLSLQDLKDQWDKQKGICPYTAWELRLPDKSDGWYDKDDRYKRASVDRIDSSKGYTKENIQFTAVIANYAKNDFPEEDMIKFCHAVAEYRSS